MLYRNREKEKEEIEVTHPSLDGKNARVLVGNVFDKDRVKGHRKKTREQQRKRAKREENRF